MSLIKKNEKSLKPQISRWRYLESSGLDRFSFETKLNPNNLNRIEIIYRNPFTSERMKTPDGRFYKRYRIFKGGDGKYRTNMKGGIHLYFPQCRLRGNIIDYLKKNPDEPIYFTEGEKKAAKAWLEGIPCIGLSGIWCWLANKQDRLNKEKRLHPDFNFIPYLENRQVIMVYDSDAMMPEKKENFENCSKEFERCLRARGVSRYEKIILPHLSEKTGLDDYLLEHKIYDFEKLVNEQSKTIPLGKFVMTSDEYLSANFPPIHFVIQPWLTDCGLTMIHAAAGVGKTYFLLGLAAAITRTQPPSKFCGWKVKRGAGVLFIDGEMASIHMQERLAKVEAYYPSNPASKMNTLSLLSCVHYSRQTGRVINLTDETRRDELTKCIESHPAKVIILDNIVSLMTTKDENDAGSWSTINQWLLSLRAMGKSVIIVHHSSKHGTQRGTSHRTDNLDTIIKLDKSGEDGMKITFEKHRNFGGAEASPVHIDFKINKVKAYFKRSENFQVIYKSDNKIKILNMLEDGKPQKDIAQEVGVSPGRVSQVKKEYQKSKGRVAV